MRRKTTPLSVPAFRRVWAGATVSAAGDAASWVALVALSLGPARASLPVLVALYTAPVAVGGLAAGWALDRFDRRRLMMVDSVLRGAAFASISLVAGFARVMALLTSERDAMPWHDLYALTVPNTSFNMFFNIAHVLRAPGAVRRRPELDVCPWTGPG